MKKHNYVINRIVCISLVLVSGVCLVACASNTSNRQTAGENTTSAEELLNYEGALNASEEDWAEEFTTEYQYDNTPNEYEPREVAEEEIQIDITEDQYVTMVNDLYVNAPDYIGQMVRIEGMVMLQEYEGNTYYHVYRRGPGCCSTDGERCGLEFTYNGELPKEGDWVEVIGTLREYLEGNFSYLTIDAYSVKVKEERGAEEVHQ